MAQAFQLYFAISGPQIRFSISTVDLICNRPTRVQPINPSAKGCALLSKALTVISMVTARAAIKTGSEVGCLAPDFELKDDNGNSWNLNAHRGKVVALVFYPKDEGVICTKQLCSMRDRWPDYQTTGAEVVAVSVGSVESHRSFAVRHSLPMPILADEHLEISRLLDVKFVFGNISQRAVIVIDRDGVIRYRKSVLPIFRPTDDEVLALIKSAAAQ